MTATTQMKAEEVDAEFGKVNLSFHSYFKYAFTFVGTSDDGKTIEAVYGGDGEDIYRFEVKAADGLPFVACGEWRHVRVFSGSRKVFDWSKD